MIARGLVFLDDLHSLGASDGGGAEWAKRAGVAGELVAGTAAPPPVTIVVLRESRWNLLEQSAAWLGMAQQVIVVCDRREEAAPPEGMTEAEVREVLDEEQRILAEKVGVPVTFLEVRKADEPDREGADPREKLIQLALWAEEKARAARAKETSAAAAAWPVPLRPLAEQRAGAGPHPWLPWSLPWWQPWWQPPGAARAGERFDEEDALRHLAASLCWPAAGPALLDGAAGERLDLQTGARTALPGLAGAAERWRPIAAHPDGARWLRGRPGRPTPWSLDGVDAPGSPLLDGWGRPIGVDPGGVLAWTGGRCRFTWRVLTPHAPAFWAPDDHDWPSGHGKKLYGYEDNEPLFVQLSSDGTTCLSVYEHDALITPGLPLRWRSFAPRGGGSALALAERSSGGPRALLFERSDEDDAYPADPYAADEDARDRRAVVTLGPSPQLRYAVGLQAPVYRLAGAQVVRLNPLAGDAGWAVFDEEHELVRCGRGRLLCGWDRWLHVLEDGELRREDLLTGERAPLGPADRPIALAHALVGSPHAVLLSCSEDAGASLRLV